MFQPKMLLLWLAAALGVFGLPEVKEAQKWLHRAQAWARQIERPQAETPRKAPQGRTVQAEAGRRYEGRVTAVHDGDTVRVTDRDGAKHKIRLAYIDAPETDQAFGTASRDMLRNLVLDKTVEVRVADVDQYGREVAYLVSDGLDVNRRQIESGAAWHYVSIAKRQQAKADFAAYSAAEAAARAGRTGLWQARSPLAPWQFRRQARERQ